MIRVGSRFIQFLICTVSSVCLAQTLDSRAVEETARRTLHSIERVREDAISGCESGVSSRMNLCLEYALVVEDLRLNDLFEKISASVADGEIKRLLAESQTAWIAYRDATCKFERAGHGAIESLSCKQSLTGERIRRLEEYLQEYLAR